MNKFSSLSSHLSSLSSHLSSLSTKLQSLTFKLIALSYILILSSCEFREFYEEGASGLPVVVNMNWDDLGAVPSGASIYFYPEEGGTPLIYKTNSVSSAVLNVPSGYYTVMTFNRTTDEYSSMKFEGMDALGTAEAILNHESIWAGSADSIGYTVCEPEKIAVGRTSHFQVRTMAERNKTVDPVTGEAVGDTCKSTPKRLYYTASIRLRVDSIQAVSQVKAYVTGLARGRNMYSTVPSEETATQSLESWTVERDADNYFSGYLNGTFKCFGLPTEVASKSLTNRDKMLNHLFIKILCVDGTTIVSRDYDIGNLIEENDSELTMDITRGTGQGDGDTPIVLPNVKPIDGSESMFDVNFEDWGDSVNVVLPL